MYRGIVLKIEGNEWVAYDRGNEVARGSKSDVFEAIDRLSTSTNREA